MDKREGKIPELIKYLYSGPNVLPLYTYKLQLRQL